MNEEDMVELKKALSKASESIDVEEVLVKKSAEQIEAEDEVAKWKNTKNSYVTINNPEFNIPKRLLRVLMNTTEYDGLIIHGEGGIGKTISMVSEAKELLSADEWVYINGYSTPLALYEALFQNRNKKLIIFDDVEGIFDNKISMAIMKGGLSETDSKRIIQYNTKSNKAEHLPSSFLINSKITILCNDIPKEYTLSTQALLSRVMVYKPQFTYEDKLSICEQFLNFRSDLNVEQKINVMRILKAETSVVTKDFNFRTLRKAIALVIADDNPQELFRAIIHTDDTIKAYLEAVSKSSDLSEQIIIFSKLSSKSRATFYRIKKQISKSHEKGM